MKLSQKLLFVICLMGVSLGAFAQQKISGTVKDVSGLSVIGASVRVEGTNVGTVTDAKGTYSLTIPPKASIEVACIGYSTQVISVAAGQAKVDVVLQEDATLLQDVVVIGYGTTKKSDFSGSISSLSSNDFKIGSNLTPQTMM